MARRHQLGLARKKAAESVGMSKDTWKRVEEGNPVRAMNYSRIDGVLGWAIGSCDLIASGGDPVPATESATVSGVTIADVTDRAAKAQRIVEGASVAVTNLPADEIRALTTRILKDLQKEGFI